MWLTEKPRPGRDTPPPQILLPPPNRYPYTTWSPVLVLSALDRMERVRKRVLVLLIPVVVLFLLVRHHWGDFEGRWSFGGRTTTMMGGEEEGEMMGVNGTLGFGAVIAVSHEKSPRKDGLLWAAQLAGVDVVVPRQPVWTEADVRGFRSGEESMISRGSALAWMGHLNALRWFLSTTLTTALILEDDTDFSLHLLPQTTLASHALRTLLSLSPSPSPPDSNSDPHFWAPPSTWDILWLGHCSDDAPLPHILQHPSLTYPDPYIPPLNSITRPTADLMRAFNLSDGRLVYKSYWPLCTFAYAVTRESATRILREYGTEGEKGCVAYDVRLLEACRDGGWRCWTVAPELFHHVEGRSEIASVNEGVSRKGEVVEEDGEDERREEDGEGRREKTVNIECGAREEWLWVDGNDTEGRKVMMQKVREASRNGGCY